MLNPDIKEITKLGRDDYFGSVLKKLVTEKELDYEEKSYILACAILLTRHFQVDRKYITFADLAYYIILKYSLSYGDYRPLYDYSLNFGFYPISKFILDKKLLNIDIIYSCFTDFELEKFKNYNNIVETLEQNVKRKSFIEDNSNEKGYLAPTSFGKSSLITQYIKELQGDLKIGVVVPTKSLLMQTYQSIRESNLGKKIIIHDEMYNGETSFVAVFTQERSLRLLSKEDFYFDVLIIDEAHNIFKSPKDGRSVLLSRLIAKNRLKNNNQKVIYLSPLIDNIENLKIYSDQKISSHVINFNVKEPEIFEYRLNNEVYKYNRFLNEFYKCNDALDQIDYLKKNSGNKNFIYNYRPVKIEQLAEELHKYLPKIEITDAITEIEKILVKEVHKDFYGIEYLRSGLIYLHGKLPDLLKEYLEFKFKTLNELKFVIANSVILEGMNLPIDTLFIFNTRGLKGKEMVNLIGRVNRLNTIFNDKESNLNKLLPRVHFVNNEKHNALGSNMKNKIELLRTRVFDDVVENPTLDSFDINKIKTDDENYAEKIKKIQDNEKFLYSENSSEIDTIKKYIIESGMNTFYSNIDEFAEKFIFNLKDISNSKGVTWGEEGVMEKIKHLFIDNVSSISDFEIKRLGEDSARNYYDNYILIGRKKSLNERINSQFDYFKDMIKAGNTKFYIGRTYGEDSYVSEAYPRSSGKVYVDLTRKSDKDLINLAIVKLKIEDDFISFKLNKFIVMMNDYKLITEEEYNKYIYGTTQRDKISLSKYGLSLSLIQRLEKDDQLKNISFDSFNNLKGNYEFKKFIDSVDDFYRFEIRRYIDDSLEI